MLQHNSVCVCGSIVMGALKQSLQLVGSIALLTTNKIMAETSVIAQQNEVNNSGRFTC